MVGKYVDILTERAAITFNSMDVTWSILVTPAKDSSPLLKVTIRVHSSPLRRGTTIYEYTHFPARAPDPEMLKHTAERALWSIKRSMK